MDKYGGTRASEPFWITNASFQHTNLAFWADTVEDTTAPAYPALSRRALGLLLIVSATVVTESQ